AACGTGDDRHVELAVGLQRLKLGGALLLRDEVDLVDADERLRATPLDGDQIAVDQTWAERGLADRYDLDDHVDVRGDEALPVWIDRIGSREHGPARQDGSESADPIRLFGEHAVP